MSMLEATGKTKENVRPLLNRTGVMMIYHMEEAKVASTFLIAGSNEKAHFHQSCKIITGHGLEQSDLVEPVLSEEVGLGSL